MIPQRKRPIRAFHGLSGSYLNGAAPEPAPVAAAAVEVVPNHDYKIGPPLDTPPPDPFADRAALGPLNISSEPGRRKEAERSKRNRKIRREQLARVKYAFTVEGAEVLRRAAELKAAVAAGNSDMNKGACITDAPTGKGKIVYSGGTGAIVKIGDAASATVLLEGQSNSRYWPEHDRRRVEAEGTGMDGDKAGFIVKTTDIDYGQALLNLFSQLSQEFVCRLCYQDCRSRAGFERHIEQVHGNENESGHDVRFGNVIEAEIRKVKRRRV